MQLAAIYERNMFINVHCREFLPGRASVVNLAATTFSATIIARVASKTPLRGGQNCAKAS